MPDWDMTEAVEAYRQVLDRRGVANTPSEIYLAVMTARMFWIPTLRTLEAHERRGNPSYCYMFTLKSPARSGMLGAHHGIDVGFLWGNYQSELYGSNPEVSNLSRSMQDAWLAFARTGDPSCQGSGQWPVHGERRETMMLREKCEVQEAPLEDERRIWDSAPDNVFKWGVA